jgi:3-oxoadipate enol-lactonase
MPCWWAPVVLLHAGIADRRMWDLQWPPLTAERDVVRLDLRGFGESVVRPRAANPHLPSMEHPTDFLALLRDWLAHNSPTDLP